MYHYLVWKRPFFPAEENNIINSHMRDIEKMLTETRDCNSDNVCGRVIFLD